MSYGQNIKRDTPEGMRRRTTAHKIKLITNNKQSSYLWENWKYSRKAYNMALGFHKLTHKMHQPCFKLRVWFNRIKRHRFPWAAKLPQTPVKNILCNLEQTLARFYTKRKKGETSQRYPRFKNIKSPAYLQIDNGRDNVPRFEGKKMLLGRSWKYREWRLEEEFRFPEGEICNVVLKQESYREWYACVTVEILEPIPVIPEENRDVVAGVDHGVGDTIFAYSDGITEEIYENPRFFREAEETIAQLDREIARSYKQNDGKLTNENRDRVAKRRKAHAKVKNQRNDYLHKKTTEMTNQPIGKMITESPNSNAWARSPQLGKSTHDAAPSTSAYMFAYKCERKGIDYEQADRDYASTRSCSNPKCDWFWSDMKLSDRVFICQKCNLVLDRDINAARNLRQWKKQDEQPCSSRGAPRDCRDFSSHTEKCSSEAVSAGKSGG